MVTRFDDPVVEDYIKSFPNNKIVNKDGKPYIRVTGRDGEVKEFSTEEICAVILGKMKQITASSTALKIKGAVITVPGNHTSLSLCLTRAQLQMSVIMCVYQVKLVSVIIQHDKRIILKHINIFTLTLLIDSLDLNKTNYHKCNLSVEQYTSVMHRKRLSKLQLPLQGLIWLI